MGLAAYCYRPKQRVIIVGIKHTGGHSCGVAASNHAVFRIKSEQFF